MSTKHGCGAPFARWIAGQARRRICKAIPVKNVAECKEIAGELSNKIRGTQIFRRCGGYHSGPGVCGARNFSISAKLFIRQYLCPISKSLACGTGSLNEKSCLFVPPACRGLLPSGLLERNICYVYTCLRYLWILEVPFRCQLSILGTILEIEPKLREGFGNLGLFRSWDRSFRMFNVIPLAALSKWRFSKFAEDLRTTDDMRSIAKATVGICGTYEMHSSRPQRE